MLLEGTAGLRGAGAIRIWIWWRKAFILRHGSHRIQLNICISLWFQSSMLRPQGDGLETLPFNPWCAHRCFDSSSLQ